MLSRRLVALASTLILLSGSLGCGTQPTASLNPSPSPTQLPALQPSDPLVIYINWDGFDYRYLAWANVPEQPGTPTLNRLIQEGTLYQNARAGLPSITNPMQASLVTGAWPAVTGNTYRYFDPEAKVVKQTGRDNQAETIAEAAARQGLRTLSVQQFTLQDRGTSYTDPDHLYIQPGGSFGHRVDQLIKLLRGEEVLADGRPIRLNQLPHLIALYGDDLDAVGHNEKAQTHLGYHRVAQTQKQREERLVESLVQLDSDLGRLLDALRELGLNERSALLLTSDHGMYGYQGYSALPELTETLTAAGFRTALLGNKERPPTGADLVLVSVGLQVQLSWARPATEAEQIRLKSTLQQFADQPWFGGLYTRAELADRGAHPYFADYLLWPGNGHHFKSSPSNYMARGQHDTPAADHVPLLLWGQDLAQGLLIDRQVELIDVAPTLAHLLGIEPPAQSTGQVLSEALTKP